MRHLQAQWRVAASPDIFWTPTVLYHGTPNPSAILDRGFSIPDTFQRGWDYGPAIYLTPDAAWARGYGLVLEVSLRAGAKILNLTELWSNDIIDHSYERLSREQVRALADQYGCAGVYDGDVVAIYDLSVIDSISRKTHKTADSTWRGFTEDDAPPWKMADFVILTQRRGRQRYYEVFTFGRNWRNFERLEEAKAAVEADHGPLVWRQKSMPKVWVETVAWGWTSEFTDPLVVYLADL